MNIHITLNCSMTAMLYFMWIYNIFVCHYVVNVSFQYFNDGGVLVNFTSALDEWFLNKSYTVSDVNTVSNINYGSWRDVKVISGRYEYTDLTCLLDDVSINVLATNSLTGHPVILQAEHVVTGGIAVLSQVSIWRYIYIYSFIRRIYSLNRQSLDIIQCIINSIDNSVLFSTFQVHLDKGAMQMAISPEIFSALKQSNPVRYDILRDMFSHIGISTIPDPDLVPDLTPAYMFTKRQVRVFIY